MVKRFLITTALEETWRDDAPVLFLGEWCRRYDRREKWQSLNAEVVPYHWDDRRKLYRDFGYLLNLYEELLAEVSGQLNALHGADRSDRYWRILIGPWLGYFLQMLFDRWTMLRQAVCDYEIIGARVMSDSRRSVVPNDMDNFQSLFVSDVWNEAVCGELLAWMGVSLESVASRSDVSLPVLQNSDNNIEFKRQLKKIAARTASFLSGVICSDDDFFSIASYLPFKQCLLLDWKLWQFPKLWRSVGVSPVFADHALRETQTIIPDVNDFPSVARAMIQRHIPTAYREGYRILVATARKLPWPKFPRAIFTSNAYSSDDVFKAWAADKVEAGVPLVIGQHGGNYGMARWSFTEEHQLAIADRFLTWGWRQSDQQTKIIPVGNLKGFGSKVAFDKQGGALLVEMAMPRTSYHMYSAPAARQWLDYFEDQCRFVQALSAELREQVLVRLCSVDYGWCQKQRWQDRFPSIRLDEGTQPIEALLNKSRLYISTYNATTYLESLSLNIPTIMFWNPNHWELRDSAVPALEKLKSVGIFHENPETAARQMVKVWNNIDAWWLSGATQKVRQEFCACYAHLPEHPLDIIGKILRDVAVAGASARAAAMRTTA